MQKILLCIFLAGIYVSSANQTFAISLRDINPAFSDSEQKWQNKISLLEKESLKPLSSFKKPITIALQVGHWKTDQAPDELAELRKSPGTKSGLLKEWQVNYNIAEKTAALLRQTGFTVFILPTVIPPGFTADIFIAIHADQNANKAVGGFKAAAAANDMTGKAAILAHMLDSVFTETTGINQDKHVTRNMTDYYAFNRKFFRHSISEKTIGVIVENGFLTNAFDQHILVNYPEIPARGLANGLIRFVNNYL
jgi:N-acetylmuramoyl-L-alanine amidase